VRFIASSYGLTIELTRRREFIQASPHQVS
jgi:hypothetical protein